MAGILYYVLDTETTGLRHGFHELIEISIIKYDDKVQITRTIKAEKPDNASFDALRITGKTRDDLKKGIHHRQMIEEVEEFFNKDELGPEYRCIVAHNAPFDRKFLHHAWAQQNKKFPADLWLDTYALCKKIVKREGIIKPSLKLGNACNLFGIKKVAGEHNAQDDARNAYLLLKHFIERNEDFIDLIKRIPHTDDEE